MKKIITLASILAVSGFAFANTPTTESQTAPTEQQAVFGPHQDGKKHEGKKHHEGKHKEREHKGDKKEGGFFDESTMVKSLNEAASGADNTRFMIEGYIIKQVGKDDFIFKDLAGTEHEIEVSRRAWQGQNIAPTDKIKIQGKVDKDWGKTELEVKKIMKTEMPNPMSSAKPAA